MATKLKPGMTRMSFTYPKATKEALLKLAKEDGRSLSGYVQRILASHLENNKSTKRRKI